MIGTLSVPVAWVFNIWLICLPLATIYSWPLSQFIQIYMLDITTVYSNNSGLLFSNNSKKNCFVVYKDPKHTIKCDIKKMWHRPRFLSLIFLRVSYCLNKMKLPNIKYKALIQNKAVSLELLGEDLHFCGSTGLTL